MKMIISILFIITALAVGYALGLSVGYSSALAQVADAGMIFLDIQLNGMTKGLVMSLPALLARIDVGDKKKLGIENYSKAKFDKFNETIQNLYKIKYGDAK